MEKVLNFIEFPHVRKLPPDHLNEVFDANRDKLKKELFYLLKLRLPNHIKHNDAQPRLRFIGWKPMPLLVQMLLKGLIVRFNFHFYGQQKTNDRRKVRKYLLKTDKIPVSIFISSLNGILIKLFFGYLIISIF